MEYAGYYGCDQRIATLQLLIMDNQDGSPQRTIFRFGPTGISPDFEAGEFLMYGNVSPEAGSLTLYPLRWLHQPVGYTMVGLSGRSVNYGNDFEGLVTGDLGCTTFAVHRIR
jgi:hypothetical protein